MTLGSCGAVTLAKARKLAADARLSVRTGADPAESRRQARKAETVRELAKLYIGNRTVGKRLTEEQRKGRGARFQGGLYEANRTFQMLSSFDSGKHLESNLAMTVPRVQENGSPIRCAWADAPRQSSGGSA